jgi:peptide-methionine (R)-S-oxide reductase
MTQRPRLNLRRGPALGAIACALAVALAAGGAAPPTKPAAPVPPAPTKEKIERVVKTDAEWRRQLTPEQYRVLRQKGTEMAFTGKLLGEHRAGTYACAACGLSLFDAAMKFDSGTGWPSFWAPIAKDHVREVPDTSYGGVDREIRCARCDGHLGHVFDDGPKPTGLRYCMNSAALAFRPRK